MIPKTIHYCWFGNNKKTELFYRCFRSWKKYCADYSFIEWNENNFDINCCDYVREAYEAEKWAFVTDYARLWITFHHGGIYLDTDVEVIKSFDELLNECAFFGLEDSKMIATGLGFGSEVGNPIVKRMLDDYEAIHFVNPDGTYNLLPCPVRNTISIKEFLPEKKDYESITRLKDATIYPREYFCPLSADCTEMRRTKNTYSIHWYSASWLSADDKAVHDFRVFKGHCEKVFGVRLGSLVARAVYLLRPKERAILKRLSQE